MQTTEKPITEQERQIRNRIVQVLKESREDKRRFKREIKEISKRIHWYIKNKTYNPQTLTREDHENYIENIEEREYLRSRWEDRALNIEYIEAEEYYLKLKLN